MTSAKIAIADSAIAIRYPNTGSPSRLAVVRPTQRDSATSHPPGTLRQQLPPAVDAQLPVNHLGVAVYRVPAQLELGGHLLLAVPLEQITQHRSKPRRQPLDVRPPPLGHVVHLRGVAVQQVGDRLFTLPECRVARAPQNPHR